MILPFIICSCSKKNVQNNNSFQELESVKSHTWYCFTETGYKKISLPQNADIVLEKPWTEAVRISSAGSCPYFYGTNGGAPKYGAYAIVNKKGLLAFSEDSIDFFPENSIFADDTADSMVFSNGMPVFYLFRSTFFNDDSRSQGMIHQSRPFLVEFNPVSKVFYPLVSYENLKLGGNDQISGFFWNGTTWSCAAKKSVASGVEFSYFYWQPLVDLADLNPAMGEETFLFNSMTEEEYKQLATNKPGYVKSPAVDYCLQEDLLLVKAKDHELEKILEQNNIALFTLNNRKRKPLRYIKELAKIIKNNNFDVIHVNGNSSTMVLELFAAKLAGCRCRIPHSHNTVTEHIFIHGILYPLFK